MVHNSYHGLSHDLVLNTHELLMVVRRVIGFAGQQRELGKHRLLRNECLIMFLYFTALIFYSRTTALRKWEISQISGWQHEEHSFLSLSWSLHSWDFISCFLAVRLKTILASSETMIQVSFFLFSFKPPSCFSLFFLFPPPTIFFLSYFLHFYFHYCICIFCLFLAHTFDHTHFSLICLLLLLFLCDSLSLSPFQFSLVILLLPTVLALP